MEVTRSSHYMFSILSKNRDCLQGVQSILEEDDRCSDNGKEMLGNRINNGSSKKDMVTLPQTGGSEEGL